MAGLPECQGECRLRRLGRTVWLAVLAWTLVVAASLAWNLYSAWTNAQVLATREARAHFNKDQAFRFWASRHGGIYVLADERTPSNPYLSHIPERDVVTPSGRRLTLMNPAYMVRQMMAEYTDLYGVKGRITSLKPLNPINAPDAWEVSALKRFEAGEREVFEITEVDGRPAIRLMKAMMTDASCLKCHAVQGYHEGDVRGGVGVIVPLAPYNEVARSNAATQAGTHGGIWLVGLGGIVLVGRRIRRFALAETTEQARTAQLHHKLDLVLQSVGDGIVGLDSTGLITFVNPAASAMLGYGPDELLGQKLHETAHHTRADGQPCPLEECATWQTMRDGEVRQSLAEPLWRKDGSALTVDMVTSAVVEEGRVVGGVVVFRDVSDRIEAERISQQLLERLAQSNHDLQQFAYTVSHDLQEPLRMVSSYVQLLGRRLQPALTDETREFIGYAVDGAARMSRMIADLVEYSRVETRGGPLEVVDAAKVVADALANLSMAVNEAGATVKVADGLPALRGDPTQLARLFQNLIGNAVKFRSPDRAPVITIDAQMAEGMAEFRIADNGIGIPQDAYDRIFQIFQRLHGRDAYDGTGIGLAIVKRIAERHGGRVWVESEMGAGSTFHVALPLAE